MSQHSTGFTFMFATGICVVCGALVASAAVQLKDRQTENKILDQQKQVLEVSGLVESAKSVKPAEAKQLFADNIEAHVIDLKTGKLVDGVDAVSFDQQKAKKDPAVSTEAPPNSAKVKRLPNQAKVYHLMKDGKVSAVVLPIEGYGLWSTLYGFLALDADTKTIRGITFYEHGETPGLGGEVDNALWKAKWPGRKAFDDAWKPAIEVKKGAHGPPEKDPYAIDALSGATITSNGVTNLVHFWLGEDGFGPYLADFRKTHK